ncbi:hypothetical protein FRC09_001352 [Ceratobasidium sp. 395]|nr:hypothetical protein FRC09_001352 [Ceratobasidium sp. 395]
MSEQQSKKRPASPPGNSPRKKTRAERRKDAKHDPIYRYWNSVKKLGNQLGGNEYMHPQVAQIKEPLQEFYGHLKNRFSRDKSFIPSDRYIAALIDITSLTGDYISHIDTALSQNAGTGTTPPTEWQQWRSFLARERFIPMVNFAMSLRSTNYLVHQDLQAMRMRSAVSTLRHKISLNAQVAPKIKSHTPDDQSEEKTLRLKIHLLVTTHQIVLTEEVDKLELEALRHIVSTYQDRLTCRVFWIDDLYAEHGCKTCGDNPSGATGKYKSPADGSGTPQIPGLFPSGPISLEDMNQHRFQYVTGGTTCGLKRVPGSTDAELAFFADFPDFHSLPPERTAQLERLAYLIHLAAEYSSPCNTNEAQRGLPKDLRGNMKVLGNRKAYDRKPFGSYAIPSRFKNKRRPEFLHFQTHCVPELAALAYSWFHSSYGGVVAEQTRNFAQEYRLPPLGSISIDEVTWTHNLGCNMTISFNLFSNEAHLDKDGYRYVFSIYVFVDSETGELITDQQRIANCMKGGYLIWPDSHLALRIVHCTGAVLLLWRGTHERHATILSETTDPSVTRYGTSIQINKRLFNAVQQYHKQLEICEQWELNGCQGDCPEFPELPTCYEDVGVNHGETIPEE